jgi:hypothetical protein
LIALLEITGEISKVIGLLVENGVVDIDTWFLEVNKIFDSTRGSNKTISGAKIPSSTKSTRTV